MTCFDFRFRDNFLLSALLFIKLRPLQMSPEISSSVNDRTICSHPPITTFATVSNVKEIATWRENKFRSIDRPPTELTARHLTGQEQFRTLSKRSRHSSHFLSLGIENSRLVRGLCKWSMNARNPCQCQRKRRKEEQEAEGLQGLDYSPTNDKLTRKFLVGELKKSTLHR